VSPVVHLEGFGVAFGARTILRDLTLSVQALGCTALLGPSGTGKSTLLRTLAGFNDTNPSLRTWGLCRYAGGASPSLRKPALVVQKPSLLMATVQDNMVATLPQRASLTRATQIDRVRAIFEQTRQVSLAAKLAMPVIDLPLHERQIVAILREVLAEPALLMVDEPTVNLPPEGAQAVLDVLRVLAEKRAVLMVSHHLAQTRQMAQQVILIADGVVQENAASDDFFRRPKSAAAQHFLRTGSCPEAGVSDSAAEADLPAGDDAPVLPVSAVPEVADVPVKVVTWRSAPRTPASSSAFCGPRGFVWLIPGKLAGTPLPGVVHDTHYDLKTLRDVGITRLISLTETPFDAALAARYGIECAALPIKDMQAPTSTQAWFLCESIDRYLQAGEGVAVHCKAGLGRTGTALALYWIWLGQGRVSGADALAHVRRLEAGMIQSLEQENCLATFAELVAHPPQRALPASRLPDPQIC